MIHDPELIDKLLNFDQAKFEGHVFRTTGCQADPTAFSANGGRWAFPVSRNDGTSILYTSLSKNGSIAEVVSYLLLLVPVPKKQLMVHELEVSLSKSLTLLKADLASLGVDIQYYGDRTYQKTQEIGAALEFIGVDGLIAPSARWDCQNLMIFERSHSMEEKLEIINSTAIDWYEWTKNQGGFGASLSVKSPSPLFAR